MEIFVGKRIRQFRQEMGFTIEELAFKAQLHPNYLGDIERGDRNPSLKNLNKIADGLGKPIVEIFSHIPADKLKGASKICEKSSNYPDPILPNSFPNKKFVKQISACGAIGANVGELSLNPTTRLNILSLIKSLMKNSKKDREYIIQMAKSLSNQLRKET